MDSGRIIFSVAGASLVLLEIVEAITEKTAGFPVSSDLHNLQMASVFGLAFVLHEFLGWLRR
jgi:hypothetical protein